MNSKIQQMIIDVCSKVQTGDWGIARSKGFYPVAIRVMTGRGQHAPWGNHNFPIWRDEQGQAMILDIRAGDKAQVIPLSMYLKQQYAAGGQVVICRPDTYVNPDKELFEKASKILIQNWKLLEGVYYDKEGIVQILKMYLRIRRHIPENTKKQIYCSEGTFFPYARNRILPWRSDIIEAEKYPVPIHSEHVIRAGRVQFIGGEQIAWDWIRKA